MSINIKKVAELAGVSVATISRVLNHPELVLPETRDRVLAVIKDQNYAPNWFARGLNFAKTNTIALFVPSIEHGLYQKLISGFETVAKNKQYMVFLCNTQSDASVEYDYLKMVTARRVDGMALVASMLDDGQTALIKESGIPCVHIGKYMLPGCETLCYINFEEGAYRLTAHLLSLGHKKIDLLLDSAASREITQTAAGYRRAMEGGRATGNILCADNSVQGGYIAVQKMLQQGNLPNALITVSDEQAFGVMKATQDAAIQIPSRLALASMMDSPLCSIVSPSLTSVEQPAKRLGMVAARMLFDSIENEELSLDVPQEVILQPKLKIRNSCGNTKYIYELFD